MSKMLEIKNLHAGYGEQEVLKGIDLRIKKGEIVALIGPNGAGKSTIIKSIFKIARVDSGKIEFNGKDITNLKTYELIKEGICYVNQGRIVFKNLSVRENLEISVDWMKEKNFKDKIENVYKIFPVLKERENSFAYELSGGQQQMLALGRALMQAPLLLLLDEPSLGLSPKLQKEIFASVKKLNNENKISVLIVEQNAKKAIEISDRVYLLEDGKIVLEGAGKNILKNRKIKEVYLGGRY